MSDLPLLQSYADPKKQKAYEKYLQGESQRKIAEALKLPPRSLARWCKEDGWENERRARAVAAIAAPNVAAVAASIAAGEVATPSVKLSRSAGMERILQRQQHLTGLIVDAFEADVEKTITDAKAAGRLVTRTQIAQLAMLGNNILTMERKAWCVPDKIETKDTTPAGGADRVRNLTNEQLNTRLEAVRKQRAEAERRRGIDPPGGGAPTSSVN